MLLKEKWGMGGAEYIFPRVPLWFLGCSEMKSIKILQPKEKPFACPFVAESNLD